jgi:hypothetical protein
MDEEELDGELEELLWEAGRVSPSGSAPPPGDELLGRYRQGRLSGEEERRLEAVLLDSSAARARLAELGGVRPPAAPLPIRESRLAPSPRRSWRRLALPLAAGLAVAVLGFWLALRPEPRPRFALGAAYEVSVEGLAALRSGPGSRQVLPQTLVTVRIEPVAAATAEVEFGLYRRRGERLLRLPVAPPVRLVESRGAAVFSAPAESLVGSRPGPGTFYAVAGPPGGLPRELGLEGVPEGDVETRLGADGRRFVAAVRLEVVAEDPAPGSRG